MYIEEELLDYLETNISDRRADKVRNKNLIAYYYGFGGSPWPTLKQVAKNLILVLESVLGKLKKMTF